MWLCRVHLPGSLSPGSNLESHSASMSREASLGKDPLPGPGSCFGIPDSWLCIFTDSHLGTEFSAPRGSTLLHSLPTRASPTRFLCPQKTSGWKQPTPHAAMQSDPLKLGNGRLAPHFTWLLKFSMPPQNTMSCIPSSHSQDPSWDPRPPAYWVCDGSGVS